MKPIAAAAVLALSGAAAEAGGIDRSGQPIGLLFEPGTYAEFSFAYARPSVDGHDAAFFGGGSIGNTVDPFDSVALGFKKDLGENLSMALILERPFGADILYPDESVALGGTKAYASTGSLTGILRYRSGRFSLYGGLRAERASAHVDLRGGGYGPVDGYSVDLDPDIAYGYLAGVSYEIPDIALRVAVTYNSAITQKFDTVETLGGAVVGTSPTEVKLPQSVNLDFQTGVAPTWLVFGSIRWADWSNFRLDPEFFVAATGIGLIDIEDTTTYTLGLGHQFSPRWSGALTLTYEPEQDRSVSPLKPTTVIQGIGLAAVYSRDNVKITSGITYARVGDANPTTAAEVARYDDNSIVGIGVKLGVSF
jgi:long-subunit fatty acid transport protein